MKKYVFLAAAAVSALLLASCSQDEPEDLPGILINGVRWAPANVAAPGVFAASILDAGLHYQWGRRTGWLGSSDDAMPSVSSPAGETWSKTEVAGESWPAAADPCPEGWRLPTQKDFEKLLDYGKVSYLGTSDDPGGIGVPPWGGSRALTEYGATTLLRAERGIDPLVREDGLVRRGKDDTSGAKGVIFTDRQSGEQLFFPAAGVILHRDEGELLLNSGTDGYYWSLLEGGKLPDSTDPSIVSIFFKLFVDSEIQTPSTQYSPFYSTRLDGCSVRCVLKQ